MRGKSGRANLLRRIEELESRSVDGSGLVPHSPEWLAFFEHLMIDVEQGRIAYAVLSFGGFLGMGDKLFAIPWSALAVDTVERQFILNVDKELLDRCQAHLSNHLISKLFSIRSRSSDRWSARIASS